MALTLRQLEYFVAIVDEGSFTRAAEALHVTQPGLSHQFQALEREVGGPLLERLPRSVRLTPAGRAMLPHARAAIAHAQIAAVQRFAKIARDNLNLSDNVLKTVGEPIVVDQKILKGGKTPLDAFAVAIAVTVERTQQSLTGGEVAAPIAKQVMQTLLREGG